MKTSRIWFSWLRTLLFLAALIGLSAFLWQQRYNLYDWYQLRNYEPAAAVRQLALDTTMNERAQRTFFAYHPTIEDKQAFNMHCSENEQTIVLGCYIQNQGIYLFSVGDDRLKGIQQVTAAHELLHVAYDRLSASERKEVDRLTAEAYALLQDDRVRLNVDAYRRRDPSVIPSELHSILASEVRVLPAALEDYYKRYFNNRAAIVAFSEQYEAEFTSRKNKVAEYDKQLEGIKLELDGLEAARAQRIQQINAEADRLQALRAANQIEAYNAGVPGYQQMVREYNADVRREQSLIEQFNLLVADRNALAIEENQLQRAINSRASTIEE